jgi:hypothetical protein
MDDPTTALPAHRRQQRLAGEECRCHVHRHHPVEQLAADLAEILVIADAGIVDQHVDPAERLQRQFDHGFRLPGLAQIEDAVLDAPAGRVEFPAGLGRRLELFDGPLGREKQRGALGRETLGDGVAEALRRRGPGNHRHLADQPVLETTHPSSSVTVFRIRPNAWLSLDASWPEPWRWR